VIPEDAEELGWRVLVISEVKPRPKENDVVSFVPFHLGFRLSVHPLLRWLLYNYGLRLHDLTLEGIRHLLVFIMLCKGFLGILVDYDLWQILFCVVPLACSWHDHCPMGGLNQSSSCIGEALPEP
jgi:hypothetical protein